MPTDQIKQLENLLGPLETGDQSNGFATGIYPADPEVAARFARGVHPASADPAAAAAFAAGRYPAGKQDR